MINYYPPVGKFNSKTPIAGEITLKTEKTGYKLWKDDLIFEAGESVKMLVEMEKGE